jgi:hypothetical protein
MRSVVLKSNGSVAEATARDNLTRRAFSKDFYSFDTLFKHKVKKIISHQTNLINPAITIYQGYFAKSNNDLPRVIPYFNHPTQTTTRQYPRQSA